MGNLPEWWTGPYPEVSSAASAAAYLDELGASLSRRQENGRWTLVTGDRDLLTAETEQEIEGFVLGFALAHLIVERHGLIGRRLPHPAEGAAAQQAAPQKAPPPPPPPPPSPGDAGTVETGGEAGTADDGIDDGGEVGDSGQVDDSGDGGAGIGPDAPAPAEEATWAGDSDGGGGGGGGDSEPAAAGGGEAEEGGAKDEGGGAGGPNADAQKGRERGRGFPTRSRGRGPRR